MRRQPCGGMHRDRPPPLCPALVPLSINSDEKNPMTEHRPYCQIWHTHGAGPAAHLPLLLDQDKRRKLILSGGTPQAGASSSSAGT